MCQCLEKADLEWHFVVYHSPTRSTGPSLEEALLSVLTLVKFELVAMMVLALLFAATELECGLAPLEHGLLCGPWPSPGLAVCRVCGCGDGFWDPRRAEKVSCFSEVVLSGIFKVSEWEAAAMMLSVGCMFMDNQKKRNKVVMKLKGTPASSKRGSLRSSLVDKSCFIEGDMSGSGSWRSSC